MNTNRIRVLVLLLAILSIVGALNFIHANEIPITIQQLAKKQEEAAASKRGVQVSGGTQVTSSNEFPHMISIQYYSSSAVSTGVHFCGGTIISPKHIVTAAHCDVGVTLDKLRIIAGNSNNQCLASSSACMIRSVIRFTKHPNWDSSTLKNDIAILELDQPIPLDGVRAVAAKIESMTLDQFLAASAMVNIAGWGRTLTQSGVNVLQKAMVPISAPSVCNLKGLGLTSPNQICAGNGNGIDTCGGDSGGPLFRKLAAGAVGNSLPIYILTGIVSYGPAGCGGTNVGAYTNATTYVSFVREQVGSTYTVEVYNQATVTPTPSPTPTPTPTPTPKPSTSQSCKCKCYCKKVRKLREMRLRGNQLEQPVGKEEFMSWVKTNSFKAL